MSVIIKNNSGSTKTYAGQEILSGAQYSVPSSELSRFSSDDLLVDDITSGATVINDGYLDISGASNQIDYLKNNQVKITETTPFAAPTYRTKRSKTDAWQTCAANTTTNIDFKLTAERYVSGGKIIYKDAKEGDYVTACVYDKDSVIPEAYRTALCEAWPVVGEYIPGEWLKPVSGYDHLEINTYPLNAKITVNLYLRVSYVASSETGDRKATVNYYLTKKL